jgi:hypothetical protein
MTSDDQSKFQIFTDVWCLWDSGAEVSYVLGGRLNSEVKGDQASAENGYVSAEIEYVLFEFPNLEYSFFFSLLESTAVPLLLTLPLCGRNVSQMMPPSSS